jgi:type I restriction enzyme, S subunit
MELELNYKQLTEEQFLTDKTQLLEFSDEWNISKLESLADVKTGPFGAQLHEKDYVEDGTPIITVEHLGEFGVDCTNPPPMVSAFDRERLKQYSLNEGDIVFSRVGSIDRNAIIRERENGWLFSGRLLRVRVTNAILPTFLSYYFHTEQFKLKIKNVAVGQTMPSLNTVILKNISVVVPPIAEQHAIATTLEEADKSLVELDKVITKKRNLKQATMQQLLTGKMRLPGFNDTWETKGLGEIGQFKNGINKGSDDFGHGFPFINLLDVFNRNKIVDKLGYGLVNSNGLERKIYNLEKGDVLFVRSSVKPEGVGLTSVIVQDLPDTVYSGFLIRFRDKNILIPDYKAYCFLEAGFRNKLIASSTVSANTNINQSNLINLVLNYPSSKEEQQAIANILSDMDEEIVALEQKRDKLKAVKQGMMQELLTGKTRLV